MAEKITAIVSQDYIIHSIIKLYNLSPATVCCCRGCRTENARPKNAGPGVQL